MFQSNKEYIDFLIQSGVHTFLQETPNNLLKDKENDNKIVENKPNKNLHEINEISDLVNLIAKHNSFRKKTANKFVLNEGNTQSKLMIIGDAPTEKEEKEGKPFAGEVGQLLNKMLSAIHLEREDIYITNVIPWKHPRNENPTEEEILEFMPYLQRQIEIIKPSYLYLLGSTAVKTVLSTPLHLDKLRGKWHQYKSINLNTSIEVLVSYHPAFLLKSPNYKKEASADLQMLQKKLNDK